MKTYIRRQQHIFFFKHQDIKQKEPPQKYRLGTISNTKLLAGLDLGFWSGNLFLIAPFPDLCLLVPFYRILTSEAAKIGTTVYSVNDP